MGFLERYKANQELQARRALDLQAQKEALERERQQTEQAKEAELKARHLAGRQKAEEYRREGGISGVISELDTVLRSEVVVGYNRQIRDGDGVTVDWEPVYVQRGKVIYPPEDIINDALYNIATKLGAKGIDADSVFHIAVWGCSEAYLVVENCSWGDVIFYGKGRDRIGLRNWRRNKSIFDDALEKAFNNPGSPKWNFRGASAAWNL